MDQLIATQNRARLKEILSALRNDTVPVWGRMTPQQMIEHLIDQVEFTSGKKLYIYDGPADEAAIQKHKWIYTDAQIPRNLVLAPLPDVCTYPDLQSAINKLLNELEDFDSFFAEAGTMSDHGAYGAMDYNEWVIWHSKHFRHHFMQFGLL
ncbi:DUF1569 domain-containing protein [Mucilaginibacter sp.]|uniref:DUF1569 domain-containing protein n=1 Tax=Mucilaginibacter sp. TaxID=1882438 RepID=UPI0035BC83B4